MTNARIVLSKIARSNRVKSFRTVAALILTTLMLVVAGTTAATAQTYSVLYNFNLFQDGFPRGFLAQGRDSNLYGTTWQSGTDYVGVVFRVTPSGKEKALHIFDTAYMSANGLTLGRDGFFYGATDSGGANSCGTFFKITKSGSLTILYSFTGGANCAHPSAPPIQGTDGNFYGTASETVYKITPSGNFTVLGSIPGISEAPLLQATNGDFYGTTYNGGTRGFGTVFKFTSKGIVKTVHNFDRANGEHPYGVIQATDGNLYGTTAYGGRNRMGVVYKLTPQGALTVLHKFLDPNYPHDGHTPLAGLVQATDGNFYGVTLKGGTGHQGVIFQITADNAYSVVYNFDGVNGALPESTPIQHTDGKIYGLTEAGGTYNTGVAYSFDLGLAPFVKTLPASGKVGRTVGILGGRLTGTSSVSFNGAPATFAVVSDTYIKTTVPNGATSGFVTVTTPGGALKSNYEFRVKP